MMLPYVIMLDAEGRFEWCHAEMCCYIKIRITLSGIKLGFCDWQSSTYIMCSCSGGETSTLQPCTCRGLLKRCISVSLEFPPQSAFETISNNKREPFGTYSKTLWQIYEKKWQYIIMSTSGVLCLPSILTRRSFNKINLITRYRHNAGAGTYFISSIIERQ